MGARLALLTLLAFLLHLLLHVAKGLVHGICGIGKFVLIQIIRRLLGITLGLIGIAILLLHLLQVLGNLPLLLLQGCLGIARIGQIPGGAWFQLLRQLLQFCWRPGRSVGPTAAAGPGNLLV